MGALFRCLRRNLHPYQGIYGQNFKDAMSNGATKYFSPQT